MEKSQESGGKSTSEKSNKFLKNFKEAMKSMNDKKAKLAKEEEQERVDHFKSEEFAKINIRKPEKNWREIKDPTFDIN